MESNRKFLLSDESMASMLNLLEEVDSIPLVITGSSMSPFLVHHRDTVYLSKIKQPPKQGDMIFYRRDSGQYVLHRVYRESDDYTMVGDAQTLLEYGIRSDQMLAIVTAVRRKGQLLQPGSFWWEFFRKVWIRLVPLRPALSALYAGTVRLFH